MKPTDLAVYLRAFLTHYLPVQRSASPNTISGYRYAFVLLLRYCEEVCRIPVERLCLEDVDPARVLAFLDHIENERGGCAQTRNHRLAALHSFFRYVQTQAPEHLAQCQRILAIPLQRISHEDPTYLSSTVLAALLAQPDRSTRMGRRDAMLLSVLYDTGARVQELIDLRVRDVHLASPARVRLTGKGRKTRLVPLMSNTARARPISARRETRRTGECRGMAVPEPTRWIVLEVGYPLPAQAIQRSGTGDVFRPT
jgi:site-specific recombinase XerD